MELKLGRKIVEKGLCWLVKRSIKKQFGIKVKFDFADGTEPKVITDSNGITHITAAIKAEVKETDLAMVIDRIFDDDDD